MASQTPYPVRQQRKNGSVAAVVRELALAALDALLPLILREDFGSIMPSRFPTDMLGRNAASALLTMCSDGGGLGSAAKGGASSTPALLDGRRPIPGFARLLDVPAPPPHVEHG